MNQPGIGRINNYLFLRSTNKNTMKMLTTRQVLIKVAVIIASVELVIMLILSLIPYQLSDYLAAVLDVVSLALLSTPLLYLLVIRPFVSARDDALSQINRLAHIDHLTQLANRRLLSKYLEKDIAGSIRHKCHVAVLLIDLDGFKIINDTYGHDAGDALLVATARSLESITRSEDVVSRLGGDEFVVLLNQLDADESVAHEHALQVATKIIELVNKPVDFDGCALQVGASIGIRLIGCDKVDPETAISEADTALYHAKQAGRGRAVFYKD